MYLIHFIIALVLFCILVSAIELNSKRGFTSHQCLSRSVPISFPRLDNVDIEELQILLDKGSLTSVDLVHASFPFQVLGSQTLIDKGLHQANI